MQRSIGREVALQGLLDDGLEEMRRQAGDHQRVCTVRRRRARHCQGWRTRRRARRRGNGNGKVVDHVADEDERRWEGEMGRVWRQGARRREYRKIRV